MVSQPKVLAWAKVEASRAPGVLTVPTGTGKPGAGSIASIAAKRLAIANAVIDGLITRDESRKRAAKLDATVRDAEAAYSAYMILGAGTGIDWDREPAAVNADLRAIWTEIKLDRDMLPVAAEWIVSPYAGPDDLDEAEPYGGPAVAEEAALT